MKKSFVVTKSNLPKIADVIVKLIKINNVLLLFGELGVGKTTLVKLVAKKIGLRTNVSSPTFVISKNYKLKDLTIFHYDLYRLNNLNELLEIGFMETIKNSDNIIFIEWPDKINKFEEFLKENHTKFVKVLLEHTNKQNKRKITICYEK